jgi:hypothetical protein
MTVELGIVVPLLEKNESLETFLEELALTLIRNSINTEVVIVSRSDDFHLSISDYQRLQKKYLMNLKCLTIDASTNNYGRIFRAGIANLDSRYVVLVTPDGTCDLSLLPALLAKCRSGSTLVIVNRFDNKKSMSGYSQTYYMQKLFRMIGNAFTNANLPEDSTFAYRMFVKSHYEYLAVSGNSWDMLAEQTLKTLLSRERVDSFNGTYLSPITDVRFSYFGNLWSYVRVLVRSFLHRLGIPWF